MSNITNKLKKLKTKMEMQEFLESMKLEDECTVVEDYHNLSEFLGMHDTWDSSIPLDNDKLDEYLRGYATQINEELLFISTEEQYEAEAKYKTDKIVHALEYMQENIEMFKSDSEDKYVFLMTYYEKSNIYIFIYDNHYIIEDDGVKYNDISKVDIYLLESIYDIVNKSIKEKQEI